MTYLSEPWFTFIKEGKKTIEGRLFKEEWKTLREGDKIQLCNNNEIINLEITDLSLYPSFIEFFEFEGIDNCLPGFNLEEGLKVYYKYYSLEDEKKFGVLGIKFKLF